MKSVDDLPAIWIACALAKGQSYFKGLDELRLKESDRINTISESLNKFGIKTYTTKNSLKIDGNPQIKPKKQIKISSNLDHRVAMANFLAGSVIGANILIKGFETVASSFPNFLKMSLIFSKTFLIPLAFAEKSSLSLVGFNNFSPTKISENFFWLLCQFFHSKFLNIENRIKMCPRS